MNIRKILCSKSNIILLTIAIIFIFLPITLVQIYIHDNNDFIGHIYYAEQLEGGFDKVIPTNQSHPLNEFLVLAIHYLTGLDFSISTVILTLLVEILIGFELLNILNISKRGDYSRQLSRWTIPIVLGLMIAAPIPLLAFVDMHLYFGYLGIANYHNPTIILLKPLAILNLLYGLKIFQTEKNKLIVIVVAAILISLSTLDKPNLTICILPALLIYSGYSYYLKKQVDWALLIFGFLIPSGLILVWEYMIAFTPGSGGIQIEPFVAMRLLSDHVITKFFISIIFPAGVAFHYFKEMIKDKRMVMSWLIFFFGAFYTYFLIEGGARRPDGNFGWSGEICMFLLFIFSVIFFIERKIVSPKFSIPDILLIGIFILYVLSGLIYYIYCINVNHISYLPKGIIPKLHIPFFELKPGLF